MTDTPTLRERCDEAIGQAMFDADATRVIANRTPVTATAYYAVMSAAARRAFLAWLDTADWQIVPKVATEEMSDAGWIDKEDVDPNDIYSAMLAAAPKLFEEGE